MSQWDAAKKKEALGTLEKLKAIRYNKVSIYKGIE